MVTLSHPKTPISLQIFSSMNKSPPTPSSSPLSHSSPTSTMKLKALLHNLIIISHICRVARASFSKAKSVLLEILKQNQLIILKRTRKTNKNIIYRRRNKILFGSFRLHYNWCSSSHVLPFISSPTWSSICSGINDEEEEDHYYQGQFGNLGCKEEGEDLTSYLQWLEEKGGKLEENSRQEDRRANNIIEDEIDKLADMFIASCHEKFRLEKIESYRRYQAMLARSM